MSPIGIGNSHTNTLKTGVAKLWILLVGVNQYQDAQLPSLRYSAIDCKGLGEALAYSTQGFPQKEVIIHNDFAQVMPTSATVRSSLERIVTQTRSQDTIVLYFSGHGMLDPNTQQPVLCMTDTQKSHLLDTGIGMQELLQILGRSSAHQQLLCLDTCHSGDMMLWGTSNATPRNPENLNPTPQLLQILRQRAAQSKGFCALLSCDQGQQSWEFPELGHGVFTYFLMRGLLGEAADSQGVIETDGLYKYIYRQTLQYIDKLNQQVRLINQQKRNRGDSKIHPEYPLQTPKRIVEGVGELILGFKPEVKKENSPQQHLAQNVQGAKMRKRRAIIVDGLTNGSKTSIDFGRVLRGAGGFELEYFPGQGKTWSQVRSALQFCLRRETPKPESTHIAINDTPTTLLYLRGRIEEIEDGEAWLILSDELRLSRSYLRQELRRASAVPQIIILDCPGATTLENWLEDLHSGCEQPQCAIASASKEGESELFSQVLLETLSESDPGIGLSIAGWVAHIQSRLEPKNAHLHVWLCGIQGVIDILPGNITWVFGNDDQYQTPIQIPDTAISKDIETALPIQIQLQSPVQSLKTDPHEALPQPKALPTLQKSSNAGTTDFPILESLDSATVQSFVTVSSQQHSQLEQLLIRLIGPVAPTLLKKVLLQAKNSKHFLKELAINLLPEQRNEFEVQVMQIAQTPTQTPATSSNVSSSQSRIIDATFIGQCERELSNLIGPIANYIIYDILKRYPQLTSTELIDKLAAEIPDARTAIEFQQRFKDKNRGSREVGK